MRWPKRSWLSSRGGCMLARRACGLHRRRCPALRRARRARRFVARRAGGRRARRAAGGCRVEVVVGQRFGLVEDLVGACHVSLALIRRSERRGDGFGWGSAVAGQPAQPFAARLGPWAARAMPPAAKASAHRAPPAEALKPAGRDWPARSPNQHQTQLHQLLAEVAPLQQAEEGLGRGLDAVAQPSRGTSACRSPPACRVPSAPRATPPCAR